MIYSRTCWSGGRSTHFLLWQTWRFQQMGCPCAAHFSFFYRTGFPQPRSQPLYPLLNDNSWIFLKGEKLRYSEISPGGKITIMTMLPCWCGNSTIEEFSPGIIVSGGLPHGKTTMGDKGFAPQFRTKVASVRIWIKGSWRLWFGIWVFYFHRMLNITYQVLEVDWPLTLSAKIGGHVTWVIRY